MNEAETRAEYIDPKLKEGGWAYREFKVQSAKCKSVEELTINFQRGANKWRMS